MKSSKQPCPIFLGSVYFLFVHAAIVAAFCRPVPRLAPWHEAVRPRKENENIIARSARASCINASIRSLPPLSLSLPFSPPSPLASSLAAASGCTNNDIHNAASYKQRISNRSALSCAYAPLLSSSFVDSRLWLNALIERGIVDRKSGVEKLRHADHPIETKHSDRRVVQSYGDCEEEELS